MLKHRACLLVHRAGSAGTGPHALARSQTLGAAALAATAAGSNVPRECCFIATTAAGKLAPKGMKRWNHMLIPFAHTFTHAAFSLANTKIILSITLIRQCLNIVGIPNYSLRGCTRASRLVVDQISCFASKRWSRPRVLVACPATELTLCLADLYLYGNHFKPLYQKRRVCSPLSRKSSYMEAVVTPSGVLLLIPCHHSVSFDYLIATAIQHSRSSMFISGSIKLMSSGSRSRSRVLTTRRISSSSNSSNNSISYRVGFFPWSCTWTD